MASSKVPALAAQANESTSCGSGSLAVAPTLIVPAGAMASAGFGAARAINGQLSGSATTPPQSRTQAHERRASGLHIERNAGATARDPRGRRGHESQCVVTPHGQAQGERQRCVWIADVLRPGDQYILIGRQHDVTDGVDSPAVRQSKADCRRAGIRSRQSIRPAGPTATHGRQSQGPPNQEDPRTTRFTTVHCAARPRHLHATRTMAMSEGP